MIDSPITPALVHCPCRGKTVALQSAEHPEGANRRWKPSDFQALAARRRWNMGCCLLGRNFIAPPNPATVYTSSSRKLLRASCVPFPLGSQFSAFGTRFHLAVQLWCNFGAIPVHFWCNFFAQVLFSRSNVAPFTKKFRPSVVTGPRAFPQSQSRLPAKVLAGSMQRLTGRRFQTGRAA